MKRRMETMSATVGKSEGEMWRDNIMRYSRIFTSKDAQDAMEIVSDYVSFGYKSLVKVIHYGEGEEIRIFTDGIVEVFTPGKDTFTYLNTNQRAYDERQSIEVNLAFCSVEEKPISKLTKV